MLWAVRFGCFGTGKVRSEQAQYQLIDGGSERHLCTNSNRGFDFRCVQMEEASYLIIDHRVRFVAPDSLSFNLYGIRLHCGFEDAIEVFDVGQPGEGTHLPTAPSKESKDGLKGIITSLAFCPTYTSDYYAAGSLSPTGSNIALFNETQGEIPAMFLSGGAKAGVTQLQFNPMQPHLLYASYRRRDGIYCSGLGGSIDMPPTTYSSHTGDQESTNQTRRFDIDLGGRRIAVGSQTGMFLLVHPM
ncbi:hypothetical protein MPER_01674 [Moniliophthora perniciosa FA553]|nr:hypothetical protein MPER_01674 [Moniliophthora perniciosa FA553]